MIERLDPAWKTVRVTSAHLPDGPSPDAATADPVGHRARSGGHLTVESLSPVERTFLKVSLCIGVLGVAFEMYAINSTMIIIAPALNDMNHYAWAFTMFMLGQVFSIIVVGRLVDRFGAFKPLAAGIIMFIIGLALAGSSHHMFTFLAARVVQGLGGGALNIALMVVVAEVFPGRQRSIMMTVFSFCYLLPAFIGPGVAAFIAVHIGWRYVFWLIIPLMALSAIVGYVPVRKLYQGRVTRRSTPGEMPLWAAVAGITGLAVIQGVTQQMGESLGPSLLSPRWIALALAGLVAVGVAMPRLMPKGFWLFRPGMASLMWVRLMLAGAFFASSSFIVLMLTEDRGVGKERAGWALALGAIGWVAGMVLQTRPWVRLRRDQIIVLGSALTTVAIGLIAWFAVWSRASLHLAIGALLLAGFGMGLGVSSTSLALMTLSPPESIGHNTSSLQVADGLGSAFFAGLAGTLLAALTRNHSLGFTFGWIYAVNALVCLAAMVLAITRLGRVRNESSGYG